MLGSALTSSPHRVLFLVMTLSASTLLCAACGSKSVLTIGYDSGAVGPDVGPDGGPGDSAIPPDAGPDTGRPDTGVVPSRNGATALRCDFDHETGLRAAALLAACAAGPGRPGEPTLKQAVELWEAGLFSGAIGGSAATFPVDYGCDLWRCLAEAGSSCDGAAECGDLIRLCRDPGAQSCNGSTLESCRSLGGDAALVTLSKLDCAAFGATCESAGDRVAACVRDGCRFGEFDFDAPQCVDGEIAWCGGEVSASCAPFGPTATCASFAIGGEFPTAFCHSSSGESVAGGYRTPNECEGGVAFFTSVSGHAYEIDCLAEGFAGCDEFGCIAAD